TTRDWWTFSSAGCLRDLSCSARRQGPRGRHWLSSATKTPSGISALCGCSLAHGSTSLCARETSAFRHTCTTLPLTSRRCCKSWLQQLEGRSVVAALLSTSPQDRE